MAVLLGHVADSRAAASASDMQHWGRFCLPPRQCTSKSLLWHSQASVLWDIQFISPDMLPANSCDLNPVDCCISAWIRNVYTKYQSTIRTTYGSSLLRCGLIFSTAWWTVWLVSGKKDWKHISVQKVVTLNTCCDLALHFLSCHKTQPAVFRATNVGRKQYTLLQMNEFCLS